MEYYIKQNLNDITYMSELIPSHKQLNKIGDEGYPSHPIRKSGMFGINSQTLIMGKGGSYNLRRPKVSGLP